MILNFQICQRKMKHNTLIIGYSFVSLEHIHRLNLFKMEHDPTFLQIMGKIEKHISSFFILFS